MGYGASVALLACFLLLGMWAYDRYGIRLGGVLVLPLLVLYAAREPRVIPLFIASAAVTYGVTELVHRRALLYGRRLFTVVMLASLSASTVLGSLLDVALTTPVLPLIPGVFAYNLHREGRTVRSVLYSMGWLGLLAIMGMLLMSVVGATPAWAGVQETCHQLSNAGAACAFLQPVDDIAGGGE